MGSLILPTVHLGKSMQAPFDPEIYDVFIRLLPEFANIQEQLQSTSLLLS